MEIWSEVDFFGNLMVVDSTTHSNIQSHCEHHYNVVARFLCAHTKNWATISKFMEHTVYTVISRHSCCSCINMPSLSNLFVKIFVIVHASCCGNFLQQIALQLAIHNPSLSLISYKGSYKLERRLWLWSS